MQLSTIDPMRGQMWGKKLGRCRTAHQEEVRIPHPALAMNRKSHAAVNRSVSDTNCIISPRHDGGPIITKAYTACGL